jgi:hypothetical protein
VVVRGLDVVDKIVRKWVSNNLDVIKLLNTFVTMDYEMGLVFAIAFALVFMWIDMNRKEDDKDVEDF